MSKVIELCDVESWARACLEAGSDPTALAYVEEVKRYAAERLARFLDENGIRPVVEECV